MHLMDRLIDGILALQRTEGIKGKRLFNTNDVIQFTQCINLRSRNVFTSENRKLVNIHLKALEEKQIVRVYTKDSDNLELLHYFKFLIGFSSISAIPKITQDLSSAVTDLDRSIYYHIKYRNDTIGSVYGTGHLLSIVRNSGSISRDCTKLIDEINYSIMKLALEGFISVLGVDTEWYAERYPKGSVSLEFKVISAFY